MFIQTVTEENRKKHCHSWERLI